MMFLEPHPQSHLPPEFRLWEEIADDLPKLLSAGRVRNVVDGLRPLDPATLYDEAQLRKAMLHLSFLGADAAGHRLLIDPDLFHTLDLGAGKAVEVL